ncbi:MAG: non-heme iron oxygenase ferredoxin subunit [Gaiellaceae bacterium]
MARYEVCPVDELPPGSMKIVPAETTLVGVYNCGGEYFALEDRCSHDDGPLVEGEWEPDTCTVICPRHGSNFDLRTGRPLSLPAYEPVATYGVVAEDGLIFVDVPD